MKDEITIAREILDYHEIYDVHIYQIIKTGSQVIYDNPKDLDYIVVVDKIPNGRFRRVKIHNGRHYDMIFIQPENIQKMFNFEYGFGVSKFSYFLQGDYKQVIYDTEEIITPSFDMLTNESTKKTYITKLIEEYTNSVNNAVNTYEVFNKWFVYTYTILYIFNNNTTEITKELKENVKILYDLSKGYEKLCMSIEEELFKIEI